MNECRILKELGEPPACVTNDPGFKPVCLTPWTIDLLADQYKNLQQTHRNYGSKKIHANTWELWIKEDACKEDSKF